MNDDNDDSTNKWGQYLWVLALITIIGFIVWQKWIKPPEIELTQTAMPHARMHVPQSSSPVVHPVAPQIVVQTEVVNEMKNDVKDAIPLVERDVRLLDRQSERLRKEAEASSGNTERGPRASVLTEKQILELEKKKAILH